MSSFLSFIFLSYSLKLARVFSLSLPFLLLGACSLELPNSTEEGSELSLASRIENVAVAPRAIWDAEDRVIMVRGAGIGAKDIAISNAVTGQFIGAVIVDSDHDENSVNLKLNDITAVPCSIVLNIGGQALNISVRNAPVNCMGIANSVINNSLMITTAKWKASANKLTIKGDGAVPRQLVSVFDAITGHLVGTDQSNAVGKWKVKVRNLLTSPCEVSVVSNDYVVRTSVKNAPLNCVNIPGSRTGPTNFNQAPDGAIIGPIADMSVSIGSSVIFTGTGFDPDSGLALAYYWDFDFPNKSDPDGYSSQTTPTVTFTQAGVYRVSLIVTDNLGLADPTADTRVIIVQPRANTSLPPNGIITSPAGNIEISAGGSVSFAGTGTDVDGSIASYIWNFAGGAANSLLKNPGNVIFSTPGVYLVSLIVIDNSGLADPIPQFVAVTVRGGNTGSPGNNNSTNQAPNGEIISPVTHTTIAKGDSIDFMATAFDADRNSPLRYNWNFGSLAPASTQLNPGLIKFNQIGVFAITFTVTDSLGMSDLSPSVRVVTVTGSGNTSNVAPESVIILPSQNMTITAGQSIDFMGSGSDLDNNQPLSFSWNFAGAASSSVAQNPGTIMFKQAGTYNVSLTVTDRLGLTDASPATRIITVLPSNEPGSGNSVVNLPPESFINFPTTDLAINVGQEINFAGSGSDPENNSPLMYMWMFDGAAPDSMVQNPGDMGFNKAGSYRIRLMVKDSAGSVDPTPAERIITVNDPLVNNSEPEGVISAPINSVSITNGNSINFASEAVDPDGSVVSYQWDFGGATVDSNQKNPGSVTFNKAGIFKITLYIKDNAGFYDSSPDVRYVTVVNSGNLNQAPTAKIISPALDVTVNMGDTVMFSGAGEDFDNLGNALTYSWNFAGVTSNTSQAVPGLVQFPSAGAYVISLSVMDSFGFSSKPAIRNITVVDNSIGNLAPTININSAVLRSNINLGESLIFSATATDSTPGQIKYFWNFDGAIADSNLQNPGSVKFNKAGNYKVTVYAVDALNKRSNLSAYNVSVGAVPTSAAPNGAIVTPTNNVTIMLGETLNFVGSGVDSDSPGSSLSYRWNFDGIAASSRSQNPGNVTFNKVGVFNISLTVADNTGSTDFSPAVRVVTVTAHSVGTGSGGSGNQAPNGNIVAPLALVTNIAIGGAVNFTATAVDADNNLPIAYHWRFGSGLADSFQQSPGVVVFANPGTYIVSLTVTDGSGAIDLTPDVRTIIVGDGVGVGNASAPNGLIETPTTGLTISQGQSVYFSGSATDPNGDTNLSFLWNFDGGSVNSTQLIPGKVIFATTGQYRVRFTVTNSSGVADITPMTKVITVLP